MPHSLARSARRTALSLVCCFVASPLLAQDAAESTPNAVKSPLGIICLASVERALTDVDWMFAAAERPELSEVVTGLLANVKDFKGLDRNRPLGVMVFLSDALPPLPEPVLFLPVENLDDLMTSITVGPVRPKKATAPGRYEIPGPQTMYVVQKENYAYVSPSESLLDAELPEPEATVGSMASRYDVSLAVRLQTIAPAIRQVFLAYLRTTTEAELQRRDEEPEASYLARRAAGVSNLEVIEQLVTQGRQLTLGIDASQDEKVAVIDFLVDAEPDSELAKYCIDVATKPTNFGPLLTDEQPLAASISWAMSTRERNAAKGMIQAIAAAMRAKLEIPEGQSDPAIDRAAESLLATIEAGHADLAIQFNAQEAGRFVFLGGVALIGADSFAVGLRDVLGKFHEAKLLDSLELDSDSHHGIAFHRFALRDMPEREQAIYGGPPSIWLGAGQRRWWFAVGGSDAFASLKNTMDRAATPALADPGAAPLQVAMRMLPWLDFPPPDGERGLTRQATAKNAFRDHPDAMKIDIRPTETGLRIRGRLDEGFIRLLGLSIAGEMDRQQERRMRREQRDGGRGEPNR